MSSAGPQEALEYEQKVKAEINKARARKVSIAQGTPELCCDFFEIPGSQAGFFHLNIPYNITFEQAKIIARIIKEENIMSCDIADENGCFTKLTQDPGVETIL